VAVEEALGFLFGPKETAEGFRYRVQLQNKGFKLVGMLI
jgi:hypothetical protein